MALPSGVKTVQVNIGPATDFSGGSVPNGFVTFQPTMGLVWAASGTPLFPRPVQCPLDEFGMGSVVLPASDQPGFVDGKGNAVVNFPYKVTWKFKDSTIQAPAPYLIELPQASSIIDLDLLTPVVGNGGTTVAVPVVTSVNGQTGAVVIAGGGGTGDGDVKSTDLAPVAFSGVLSDAGGSIALAQAAPGSPFYVTYDTASSSWKFAGTTITSRPSSRTDLVMIAITDSQSHVPNFALAGIDLLMVDS